MNSHFKTAFLGISLTALLACVATNKNIVANTVVDKSLPSLEDTYGVWKVFTVDQSDKKVCYVSSNPVETNSNHHGLRDPYVMVAFFEHGKQEVSISAGYTYKMKSVVAEDIKYGTLVAYIVDKEDTNIETPIGRVLIKPYKLSRKDYHGTDPAPIVYSPEVTVYSPYVGLEPVRNYLKKVCEEIQNDKSGTLRSLKQLYNDTYNDKPDTKFNL